jgi:hypothetical protein
VISIPPPPDDSVRGVALGVLHAINLGDRWRFAPHHEGHAGEVAFLAAVMVALRDFFAPSGAAPAPVPSPVAAAPVDPDLSPKEALAKRRAEKDEATRRKHEDEKRSIEQLARAEGVHPHTIRDRIERARNRNAGLPGVNRRKHKNPRTDPKDP